MEVNIIDDKKSVEVWLTHREKQDEKLRSQLTVLYRQYKAEKYFVAEYQSGDQDLAEETSALLCYNRKRLAEQEVRRKREGTPQRAGAR